MAKLRDVLGAGFTLGAHGPFCLMVTVTECSPGRSSLVGCPSSLNTALHLMSEGRAWGKGLESSTFK